MVPGVSVCLIVIVLLVIIVINLFHFDVISTPIFFTFEQEIEEIREVPMSVTHIIIVKFANNPWIKAELWIRHVSIRNVTVSTITLLAQYRMRMNAVKCDTYPLCSP